MRSEGEERHVQESHEQQGGEPACFLNQVCEECGRVREDPSRPDCENCGHDPQAAAAPDGGTGSRRRDRDPEGKARNARPRDGLGRPLPYGEQGVPRQPEGVVRTPDRTLDEAQRLLDDGMPFHAHEVLEDAWKSAPEAEAPLWKGLAQLAVGITHLARGNTKGGARLLLRGGEGVEPYRGSPPHGIDVAGLADWARTTADGADQASRQNTDGPPTGKPTAPRLRGQG